MWNPKTYWVFIASKPIVNKSKQEVELLVKNFILPPLKLFWQSAEEPKPRGKLRKKSRIKNKKEYNLFEEVKALNKSLIRAESPQNWLVIQKLRINLGRISDENLLERLMRLVQEFVKSITETSSKVCEPKTYNKAINNAVHKNK